MNVYLDYAATSPLLPEVLEEMLPLLKEHFGNADSLHGYGRRAAAYLTDARDRIAKAVGALPSEVYFTSGGTEADNWAMRCLGEGGVLLSPIEHAAVRASASMRTGGARECPVGENGVVTAEGVRSALYEGCGLVSVMAVNNETGCISELEKISVLAKERGTVFFSDCVQAACSLDLKKIWDLVDAMALSAHKLGGPKGVGALLVKKGVRLSAFLRGGEQERGLRGGTVNVAGAVGFARALEEKQAARVSFCAHTGALRDLFERILSKALGGGMKIDGEHRAPNLSHITFEKGNEALLNLLDLKGVAASGGAACSAHSALPSHVLLAMGRTEGEAKRGIRFSFGAETTEEEVRFAAETVLSALS